MSASGPPIEEMTAGWRLARTSPSLPESFRSVAIPAGAPWWRKMLAFAGPGYLVAVGYMDPGNWATDLAGGSRFGYTLLSVILISIHRIASLFRRRFAGGPMSRRVET